MPRDVLYCLCTGDGNWGAGNARSEPDQVMYVLQGVQAAEVRCIASACYAVRERGGLSSSANAWNISSVAPPANASSIRHPDRPNLWAAVLASTACRDLQ